MEAPPDPAEAAAAPAAVAPVSPAPLRGRIAGLRSSGTMQAAGLALATLAQQVLAVVVTVVFTRLLGADGYGSLAALINLTVILLVPGSALQVAAAREGTLGRLGRGGELAATLDRWTRHLLWGMAALVVVSILARHPLAQLVDVEQEWAAAAVPVAGAMWLLLSLQRGLLQAAAAYRPVGLSIVLEALGRVAVAVALVAAGAGVTGAYLGTLASFTCAALALHGVLRRRLGAPAAQTRRHPLRELARDGAIPILGLILIAALQNVDVIVVRHTLDDETAGVYAAATVAAKAIVWVAVGIGLWVLPEATRRAAAGLDPRRVLVRALALIAALAIPALAIFAAVPELLLRLAFGAEYERGATVLLTLGGAFALLACSYLAVQFLLGLHRWAFIGALAVAAAAEPLLLLTADGVEEFARIVLLVHAGAAAALLVIALAIRPRAPAVEPV